MIDQPPSDPHAPRLAALAQALVNRLEEIHTSAQYRAVWELHHLHGGTYAGPNYAEEVKALKAELAILSADPPVPSPPAETLSDETRRALIAAWHDGFSYDRITRDEADQKAVDFADWQIGILRLSQAGPPPASGLCDNEMTQSVGQRMRRYTCQLAADHEGSCQFTQVAEDRS